MVRKACYSYPDLSIRKYLIKIGSFVGRFMLLLGAKKYPVELPMEGSDGEGPTVEDLANLAALLTEVPRGSQRLIFKGTVNILCNISVLLYKILKQF